ncbi:MAG: CarD family transcriptional regulator [Rhizobiales bacterium]|nr:CarD family transcriptional regulator [Hyphomicrobiales bacterium]
MATKVKKAPKSTPAKSASKPAASKAKAKAPAKPSAAKAATKPKAKAANAKTSASKSKAAKPAAAKKASAKKAETKPAAAKKPAAKKAEAAKAAKPAVKKSAAKPAAPAKKPAAKKAAAKPAAKTTKAAAKPAAKAAPKTVSNAGKLLAAAKSKAAADKVKAAEAKAATEKAAAEKVAAEKAAEAARKEAAKPVVPKPNFKSKEFVVYPAHGVGQILDVETQEVAGHRLELFVINFDKEKMTLRVPTHKAQAVGMRKLSDATVVGNAIETLRGRARIKRTMWSRRAQEYEAKINSGDLISIAEVVRDLYRSDKQPEQSYSERQLYEAALDRMAREVAVVERIEEDAAITLIETALQAVAPAREKAKADAEAADNADEDTDGKEEAA